MTIPYMPELTPVDDEGTVGYQNNLSDQDRRKFYLTIKDSLCEKPYACAMMLIGLANVE